jgi:hypothetical protein
MFQIIGAMAEFERTLIQERVKAGLRNARAKGRRLGRPRAVVDEGLVHAMRKHKQSVSNLYGFVPLNGHILAVSRILDIAHPKLEAARHGGFCLENVGAQLPQIWVL